MLICIKTTVASLAPNSGLLGGSLEDAALVDQWIHLVESEVDNYTNFIHSICQGRLPYNKAVRHSSSYLNETHPSVSPDTLFRHT